MLSRFERKVLALVRDQHTETQRGARGGIVFAGMGAKAKDRKQRVLDALESLKKAGLLISGPYGWVPSQDAAAALDDADGAEEEERTDSMLAAIQGDGAGATLPPVTAPAVEQIGEPVTDELLNRCAAMHRALLAQAEEAYAAGDPDAWRELRWLMETGSQLLAAGGLACD